MANRFLPTRLPQEQINAKIAANKPLLSSVPMAPSVSTPTPVAPSLTPAPAPLPAAPRFTPDRLPQADINANLEAAKMRTATGLPINPRTGGVMAPPPTPVETPAPPVNPYEDDVSAAEKAFAQSFQLTPEEMQTQEEYDNVLGSTQLGVLRQEGQGRGIPLSIVRGNQKRISDEGLLMAETLERKLARQQAQRMAAAEASKFSLERADKLSEGYKSEQVRKEGLARQDAATAQERKDQALQFAFENDISTPFFRHNGTIYRTSDLKLIGSQDEARRLGVASDGSNVSDLRRQATAKDMPASVQEYEYAVANGYTGSFTQYQNEDANRKAKATGLGGLTPGQVNTTVNSIASAFDNEPIVREYNTVKSVVQALSSAGVSSTDDIQRVYAFAKIMDPNSAVREGEYKTVQDYSTALLQRMGINVQRAFDARGFLTEDARKNMQATLQNVLNAKKSAYDNVAREYQRQIDDAYSGRPRTITDYSGGSGTSPGWDPLDDALRDAGFNLGGSGPANAQAVLGKAQPSPIALAAATKYPVGSTGGQCTTFLHKIASFPPIGDGLNAKKASVDKFGIPKAQWQPRVGDIIVTDDNETYGHTMMLTLLLPGNRGQVTESNWKGNEKVTHSRIVDLNGSNIYGAIRPKSKLKTTLT